MQLSRYICRQCTQNYCQFIILVCIFLLLKFHRFNFFHTDYETHNYVSWWHLVVDSTWELHPKRITLHIHLVITPFIEAASGSVAVQGCMNSVTFGDENVGYYETVAGGAGAVSFYLALFTVYHVRCVFIIQKIADINADWYSEFAVLSYNTHYLCDRRVRIQSQIAQKYKKCVFKHFMPVFQMP